MNETHKYEWGVSDFIQASALVADGVVRLRDGGLLAGWRYTGPAITPQGAVHLRNGMAKLLNHGKGWIIETNIIRLPSVRYPAWGTFPDPVSQLIEAERIENYTTPGHYFETHQYMSLTYLPPSKVEERARGFLYSGNGKSRGLAAEALEHFQSKVAEFETMLGTSLNMRRLKVEGEYDNLLRYIQLCITGEDRPFLIPDPPIHLDYVLGGASIGWGRAPLINKRPLRILSLDPLPKAIPPAMIYRLQQEPLCFRLHGRGILLDRTDAAKLMGQKEGGWASKVVPWLIKMLNMIPTTFDVRAKKMEVEASVAKSMTEDQDEMFAHYSGRIILIRDTEEEMCKAIATVKAAALKSNLKVRDEWLNAADCWFGSLPGHWNFDVRQVPIRSYNIAGLSPLQSVHTGHHFNPNPKMPKGSSPLLVGTTEGMTPYRLSLHVEDVGHTAVIGPTGSGKTTLFGLLAISVMRHPGARVVMFDRNKTQNVLCRALGGTFYDLGTDRNLSLCPLQNLETPADIGWAGKYITTLCQMNGLTVTTEHTDSIGSALKRLSRGKDRSLTHFGTAVCSTAIQAALQLYTCGNPMSAEMLDGETDSIQDATFTVFELGQLMEMDERIRVAVQLHLFRRIERKLNPDHVTAIFLDEARRMVANDLFAQQIEHWLKEWRNLNGFVVLALQEIKDIAGTKLRGVVETQCPTKIFLPDPGAIAEHTRLAYTSLGVSEDQINQIVTGQPKSDYFVATKRSFTRMHLDLQQVALAFLASSTPQVRGQVDRLMEANPDTWQADFLRSKGLDKWADAYERMTLEILNGRSYVPEDSSGNVSVPDGAVSCSVL